MTSSIPFRLPGLVTRVETHQVVSHISDQVADVVILSSLYNDDASCHTRITGKEPYA